jgi:hypothetical protein
LESERRRCRREEMRARFSDRFAQNCISAFSSEANLRFVGSGIKPRGGRRRLSRRLTEIEAIAGLVKKFRRLVAFVAV